MLKQWSLPKKSLDGRLECKSRSRRKLLTRSAANRVFREWRSLDLSRPPQPRFQRRARRESTRLRVKSPASGPGPRHHRHSVGTRKKELAAFESGPRFISFATADAVSDTAAAANRNGRDPRQQSDIRKRGKVSWELEGTLPRFFYARGPGRFPSGLWSGLLAASRSMPFRLPRTNGATTSP
jgi:hypothetical protein